MLAGAKLSFFGSSTIKYSQVTHLDQVNVILCEFYGIELKSLILAQIERWRNALHMQVERQRGATWRRAANGCVIHRNMSIRGG